MIYGTIIRNLYICMLHQAASYLLLPDLSMQLTSSLVLVLVLHWWAEFSLCECDYATT